MLTGPKLPFSERLPFLCAGVTFANFIHGGKRLASKDLLNSEYKASVKMSEVGLIIFVGISESWHAFESQDPIFSSQYLALKYY